MKAVDLNASARFTIFGVARWLGVRLDIFVLVFNFINLISIVFLVTYTNYIDRGLAALTTVFDAVQSPPFV